ncbi:MAG: OmpA family protein [Alistipes sp.]
MEKCTATYGTWRIDVEESGSISVYDNGSLCDNSKQALCEIADKVGFTMQDGWNTRQMGRKLVDFLNENNPVATVISAPEPKTEVKRCCSTPAESFEASGLESATAKVRVYGKAQNRTALGVAHAYMAMYPHATLEDLRKAFPNSLNPDSGVKEIFILAKEKGTSVDWNVYFKGEDEVIFTGDGKKVAMVSMWTKPSFERIIAQARANDIVVAKFEAADKGGKKGGFRLEYLNGYVPSVPKQKKSLWLVWLLLLLLVGGVAVYFAMRKPEVVEVEKIVYVDRIEEIEKNFNAAQFVQGKAELSEDAKFVLHDLAKEMQKHPEVRLRIVGHTSLEGNPEFNQKLSEARAQAAVDFLVGHGGIDAGRLEAVGKGSSEPVDTNNPEANRRTEFIVIE